MYNLHIHAEKSFIRLQANFHCEAHHGHIKGIMFAHCHIPNKRYPPITPYTSTLSYTLPTRIDGASDDSAEWVPRTIIEPVVKLVKALLGQETSGAVIEIPESRNKERHNHAW